MGQRHHWSLVPSVASILDFLSRELVTDQFTGADFIHSLMGEATE